MITKVERIFYPIGQGAFYAEKFHFGTGGDFNIVYDCGNSHNTKLGDRVIEQAFTNDDNIDVLYISHFDYDHVSKVNKLKSCVRKIKKVILPLLEDDEKKLLISLNRIANYKVLQQLIESPSNFFGDDTKIIYIRPSQNTEPIILGDNSNIIEFDSMNNSEIEMNSGTAFSVSKAVNWLFIPFNYKSKKRKADLIKSLKENYDVDKLINNPDYVTKIIKDEEKRKNIKRIYNGLDGGINQNSLILYSGPKSINQWHNCSCYYPQHIEPLIWYYRWYVNERLHLDKVACVYTGDTDLKEVKIRTIYGKFWDYVGTIQIPHHGSLKSFDLAQIRENVFCPISVGKNNYGHPSISVISQILSKLSLPILVKDDLFSFFIECFTSK